MAAFQIVKTPTGIPVALSLPPSSGYPFIALSAIMYVVTEGDTFVIMAYHHEHVLDRDQYLSFLDALSAYESNKQKL